jgi:hypothetical protein
MMVDADFNAAEAAEVLLSPMGRRTVEGIGLLAVDPLIPL